MRDDLAVERFCAQRAERNLRPAVASLRHLYVSRVRRLEASDQLPQAPFSEADKYRALRLEMLGVERAAVVGLRQQGRINATVLRAIERSLDLEEARLLEL